MINSVVCITGGTGFVGREVVREFLESGYHVRALVRSQLSAQKLASLKTTYSSRLEFITGDAMNSDDIRHALEGAQALVHLVGIRREEIKRSGLSYASVDLASAIAAATAMQIAGTKRILFLSAGAIGKSEYVRTKAKAEQVITDANLDWTIFRPAFIVGPGQRWPVIMSPILWALGLLPGNIGDVARRAGNIERTRLAQAFVSGFENDRTIGKVLEVSELRKI